MVKINIPIYKYTTGDIHKIYASLRDAYLYAGNVNTKEMLFKLSDWFFKLLADLADDHIEEVLRTEWRIK